MINACNYYLSELKWCNNFWKKFHHRFYSWYEVRCVIWYHLYNFKNVNNSWRSVNFSKVASWGVFHVFNPSRPDPGRREKINLNFYLHTSLQCLRRFYEGLKGRHKTFWSTTKKCENKNLLIFILIRLSEMYGARRVKIVQMVPNHATHHLSQLYC